MTSTYQTITGNSGRGAYDFPWYWDFQRRRDGRRFRLISGGFSWAGNQGGYKEHTPIYMTRTVGRKFLRALRHSKVCEMQGIGGNDHVQYALHTTNLTEA